MSLGRANARAWMIPAKLSVLAITSAGALSWGTVTAEDRMPPNILLIYVDDWGWQDAGFMGSRYYEGQKFLTRLAVSWRGKTVKGFFPLRAPEYGRIWSNALNRWGSDTGSRRPESGASPA